MFRVAKHSNVTLVVTLAHLLTNPSVAVVIPPEERSRSSVAVSDDG